MPVSPATATAGATRGAQPSTAPAVMMSQQDYLNSKASNPVGLKAFLKDWVELGGRGIIGGDGQPASYWDVYQDLAASGMDVTDLTPPDQLPQGTVKGGGQQTGLANPAPAPAAAAPAAPTTSPELSNLLSRIGVKYENAPAATPALLAFLNQLDLNMSTAEDTKSKALQLIQGRSTTATEETNRGADRSRMNVTADLIRRGVLQSGEATGRFARGDEDRAAKLSDIAQSTAEGSQAAETAYRSNVDNLRAQALGKVMETEMAQKQGEATSQAQKEALEAQKQAAELAYQRQMEAQKRQEELLAKLAQQGVAV